MELTAEHAKLTTSFTDLQTSFTALTAENASLAESFASLTAEKAELTEKLSFFATKAKVEAKAEKLGVVVENMDEFISTNTDFESQVEALFDLKEVSVATNSKEFLASAPKSVGDLGGDDDFIPKNRTEAMAHLKAEYPELTARERQAKCLSLYPKLWEK